MVLLPPNGEFDEFPAKAGKLRRSKAVTLAPIVSNQSGQFFSGPVCLKAHRSDGNIREVRDRHFAALGRPLDARHEAASFGR